MWQQGVISEDDYRNGAAQPLVLAEEDSSKKSSSTTSYFTDALFNEVVKDIMAKEGVDESTAQSMLYTGGYTIEATVNPKIQTAMENLMLNTDDAYFPAGWHEEEVTSISDDDVQVYNEDGTPKTRTGDDGTVYYYRNVRTQAAMVTLDYDGNVLAMVGGLGEKTKSLSLNRAYGVDPADRLHHQAHRRVCAGHRVWSGQLVHHAQQLAPLPQAGHGHPGRGLLPQERPDGPFRQVSSRPTPTHGAAGPATTAATTATAATCRCGTAWPAP